MMSPQPKPFNLHHTVSSSVSLGYVHKPHSLYSYQYTCVFIPFISTIATIPVCESVSQPYLPCSRFKMQQQDSSLVPRRETTSPLYLPALTSYQSNIELILELFFKDLHGLAPDYLFELLIPYSIPPVE